MRNLHHRVLGIALLAVLTVAGCKAKAPDAPEAPAPAAPPAAQAPAPEAAPAPEPPPPPVEVAWATPTPESWAVVNDYEATWDPRKNSWGGFWDTWKYRVGDCKLEIAGENGPRHLKVAYTLPADNSQCGTFEYLKGDKGKPEAVDLRDYARAFVVMKSGDDREHRVRLEVVELDPYDAALQGYTGTSAALVVGKDWKRYEMDLDKELHPHFNRKMGKTIGIRIDRKDQANQEDGVVLVDGLGFIRRDAAAK